MRELLDWIAVGWRDECAKCGGTGRDQSARWFLAEAAARGEELAAIDDRWQEGGFDEAEAMDFDGDYDDDGGMPDS